LNNDLVQPGPRKPYGADDVQEQHHTLAICIILNLVDIGIIKHDTFTLFPVTGLITYLNPTVITGLWYL
jgi:hypothetical protein